jgi:hypothetical protein
MVLSTSMLLGYNPYARDEILDDIHMAISNGIEQSLSKNVIRIFRQGF